MILLLFSHHSPLIHASINHSRFASYHQKLQLFMNLLGKLQSEYEQLWKYIIRPSRTPYAEESMGPTSFHLQGQEVIRRDFQLTNSRGFTFAASLWLPTLFDKCNCVLYLHGNSGNRTEGMEYLGKLIKHNLALCTFDFSGCGNAEGEYVTLGYYEQEDLRLVAQQLRKMDDINHLALWGRSMGAVTSMLYLAKTIDIKAAVFDSPFKSLKTLVEDLAKKNSKIPSFVLAGAIKIISRTVEDKAGFSIYNINPLKYSVPGLYCPAFFIVALDDQIVPTEHTKQLFAVYGGEDKIIKMVKGKHNDSRPQDCVNEAVSFLLQRFGHDWKEGLKKQQKKEFDFFQMEKLQEQEREEHRKQEVNFFEEAQKQVEQQQQVEDHTKKGQFSLSGLFSIFSRDKKQKKQKKQLVKDGYQDTRAILSKKGGPDSTKIIQNDKRLRQQYQDRMRKQAVQADQPQALPTEWVMFVI